MASKLVLVVRTDLELGRGKIAAQVAHAAVAATLAGLGTPALQAWLADGQPKVVCRVADERGLRAVVDRALRLGVAAGVITDAGRTQVAPGTPTVAYLGPDLDGRIDEISADLRLL